MIPFPMIEMYLAIGAFVMPIPSRATDCEQHVLRWHSETVLKPEPSGVLISAPVRASAQNERDASTPTLGRLCEFALASLRPRRASDARSMRAAVAAVVSGETNSDAQFALILSMNQAGESMSAVRDASFAGSQAPLVRLEHARALLLNAVHREGASAVEAAVRSSPAAAALFYYYSEPVLTNGEKDQMSRAESDSLADALLHAWRRRATLAGLTLGERLAVHFRRRLHADTMYWSSARSEPDSLAAVQVVTRHDPRWPLFIRFGAPWKEVHTPYLLRNGASGEFVTWAYLDPEHPKPILFHFSGVYARYTLSTPPPCTFPNWYSDRVGLSSYIGQLYNACSSRSGDLAGRTRDLRRRTQDVYREYAERDFVNPTTPGPKFTYALYQFADNSDGSATELIAVAAIRNEDAPVRMSAALFLQSNRAPSMYDNVGPLVNVGASSAILSAAVRPLSDGEHTYRVRVADSTFSKGFVYGGDYTVRDLRADPISDVIVARAETGNVIKRGEEWLTPILGDVLDPTFRLYLELYGLTAGEAIHTEIEIARDRGILRRGVVLKLEFDEPVSSGGVTSVRRDISHGLEPGTYSLTVRVRSMDGKVTRERRSSLQIGKR